MSQLKIFQKMGKTKLGRFIIKGGATLATGAALAAGIGCNSEDIPVQVIIEDPNPVNNPGEEEVTKPGEEVSDKPGDVVEPVEPEEVKEEIDRYAQVPEEELDENGKYIPVDVTADMLRERLDDLEAKYSITDEYIARIKSTTVKANYPFISDEDFETIVKEYDIDLSKNYTVTYKDYGVDPELFYFDSYLQYEARVFYDLNHEREIIWQNINDNNGLNDQDDMDLVEEKIDCLMLDGKYESEDETILVPFTANDATAKLETNNEKDAKISLSFMLKQYGIAYGNSMEYNDLFEKLASELK